MKNKKQYFIFCNGSQSNYHFCEAVEFDKDGKNGYFYNCRNEKIKGMLNLDEYSDCGFVKKLKVSYREFRKFIKSEFNTLGRSYREIYS